MSKENINVVALSIWSFGHFLSVKNFVCWWYWDGLLVLVFSAKLVILNIIK